MSSYWYLIQFVVQDTRNSPTKLRVTHSSRYHVEETEGLKLWFWSRPRSRLHQVIQACTEPFGKPSEWGSPWIVLQYRVNLWKADQDYRIYLSPLCPTYCISFPYSHMFCYEWQGCNSLSRLILLASKVRYSL